MASLAALGLLAALAFVALPARGAVTEAWVQRYGAVLSNSQDQAYQVVTDASGDVIVTGVTQGNMLAIKYSNLDGSVLWLRRHSNGGAQALAVDTNGDIVVTGHLEGGGSTVKCAGSDGRVLWEVTGRGSKIALDKSGNAVVAGGEGTAKYASADGALLWTQPWPGRGPVAGDQAQSVAVDSSGNVVVTGRSTGDRYTAKYASANGALMWEQRYNGPDNANEELQSVALDAIDNVIVTGLSFPRFGRDGAYTAKYSSANGALLWERRDHGGGLAVAVDASGDVVVTGLSLGPSEAGCYSAKFAAADGALVWEQRCNDPGNREYVGNAVAVDGIGNIVVTGHSYGSDFDPDYYTAKYEAATGALLWEQRYGSANGGLDEPASLAINDNGNVAVTGYSWNRFGTIDWYTVKYAADGAMQWEQIYDGLDENPVSRLDQATAMAADSSGDIVVTGVTSGAINGVAGISYYYTAKYAAVGGTLLWERRSVAGEAIAGVPMPPAVAVDASGNVILTGNPSTIKYGIDGTLLWENTDLNYAHQGRAVALDSDGNALVVGVGHPFSSQGTSTIKYRASDGIVLWEQRRGGTYDELSKVAVDAKGDVVVAGFAKAHIFAPADYYTAKYARSDGTLLWEQIYDGPGGGEDRAQALALDANGNVIVTGASEFDYCTVKYAAGDGALLWEHRYRNPNGGSSQATAVEVDANDNVVVTGASLGGAIVFLGSFNDIYTAKYAAADGALIWERRYNGPANGEDCGVGVAIDGSGDVLVTGYSATESNCGQGGCFSIGDYYTAKYAAADGALLWEKRFNGPANEDDSPAGLAITPDGSVVVAGTSSGDIVTVLYREIFPPVITCPSNTVSNATSSAGAVVHFAVNATDDSGLPPTVTCAPASGSVFPIGQTTVTCTATDGDGLSSACSFTVTVRGARGVKQGVLADLVALRATVKCGIDHRDKDRGHDNHDNRDKDDCDVCGKLDDAIRHLRASLHPAWWIDEIHLERKHGGKVLDEEKTAVRNLCDLIQSRKSHLPDAVLQGFVDQLIQADRLLASVAIEEAISAGLSGKKIEQAQKFLARGDAEAADGQCANGIEEYRKAWKRAARAKVSPPVRLANGRVRLEIAGEAGERFTVQCSANLKDWLTLGTCTANAEGIVTFEDTDAGRHPTQFYRVVGE